MHVLGFVSCMRQAIGSRMTVNGEVITHVIFSPVSQWTGQIQNNFKITVLIRMSIKHTTVSG